MVYILSSCASLWFPSRVLLLSAGSRSFVSPLNSSLCCLHHFHRGFLLNPLAVGEFSFFWLTFLSFHEDWNIHLLSWGLSLKHALNELFIQNRSQCICVRSQILLQLLIVRTVDIRSDRTIHQPPRPVLWCTAEYMNMAELLQERCCVQHLLVSTDLPRNCFPPSLPLCVYVCVYKVLTDKLQQQL